jgi:uncharacterized phage protein (TIGR02218 family)
VTYAADVASVRAADKIELYRFTGPQISYLYSSGTRSVTTGIDGSPLTFTPLAGLRRSARGASSSNDKAALTVTMSGACDLATDYAYATPPRSLRLRVYEYQRASAAAQLVWDGDVVACSATGTEIEVRSESQLSSRLATPVPAVAFQGLCNHFLGDDRCAIDMTASGRHHETTVSSYTGNTVTVASIGAFADDWFRAGEIVRDTDGERRLIVGQIGAVLTLASPFRALAATNAVTLYAGCAHLINVCSDKYNNVANFGGHPSMPLSNPFVMNIRLTR